MSESVKLNDEKRIIVVDDDADILEFLQYELHTYDEGFTINTFENGFSALDFVMQNKCDIVITDIAMPDMNGYELYQKIKYSRPNLPIIMMTGFGYDPNHTVVNAKKAGLRNVIFKPFDMNKLMAMIYQSLAEK
ncbi:MAG: response regulator [Candidatus Cloacimonadales bacterium]|jgi:DNA-binding NtrC family response regulator|nr:response regulator [Candidatus Cloacimonadota bacterium]MDD2650064.1 response regulator [Candidatus Cloacimonadota bacterium]MDD3501712.1 response regulator [Candidatus Cloacimonadota bacterium]MDX9977137.1 response regulator [Candidatus Cloacimonadales bacterium]